VKANETDRWKKIDALIESHPDSWDESFLRHLVGKLKRREGEGDPPWRDAKSRCLKYHEHDEWAPACQFVGVET